MANYASSTTELLPLPSGGWAVCGKDENDHINAVAVAFCDTLDNGGAASCSGGAFSV